MSFLSGQLSLRDQRSWRSGSGFLSSSYQLQIGAVSYGKVDGFELGHKVPLNTATGLRSATVGYVTSICRRRCN
jgi:hypothetical protein